MQERHQRPDPLPAVEVVQEEVAAGIERPEEAGAEAKDVVLEGQKIPRLVMCNRRNPLLRCASCLVNPTPQRHLPAATARSSIAFVVRRKH